MTKDEDIYLSMIIFFRLIFIFILTINVQGCCEKAEKPLDKAEIVQIIDQINKKNEKINNIWYKEVKSGFVKSMLYCDKNGITITRSETRGRVISEVAIKSNLFWFWIKDYDPNKVFYCEKDLSKTRVKDILRPELTRLIVGIDKIPPYVIKNEKIEFDLNEFHIISTLNEQRITSHEVFKKGVKVMTAQILDVENDVPKKIHLIWHEENIKLSLLAQKIEINTKNPPEVKFPEGMKKVNLIDY